MKDSTHDHDHGHNTQQQGKGDMKEKPREEQFPKGSDMKHGNQANKENRKPGEHEKDSEKR